METTIDAAGRIVIPKAIRDRLRLRGGQPVLITEREGRIEIEVKPTRMGLKETDDGVVAVPDEGLPPLTDEVVRDAIERSRR